MPDRYLVHEGPADGLDKRVLDALVVAIPGVQVNLLAAGGDRGLGSVVAALRHRGDRALYVEDRNFRPAAGAQASWAKAAPTGVIWRRHEIENYLLEPRTVLRAFLQLRGTVPQAWVGTLPQTLADAAELLIKLAMPLLEHHAGTVLFHELYRQQRQACPTDWALPKVPCQPGGPYSSRQQWLAALITEIARAAQAATAVGGLTFLSAALVEARYDAIHQELRQPAFVAGKGHLIDLEGKRLLAELLSYLRALGAKMTQETLEDELLTALEAEYRAGGLFQPDEFAELRQRLMAL